MTLELFYRVGISGEKIFFSKYRHLYDGITIGANFAAYYSNWIPTFLSSLKKPFFIDPMTYVFARSLDVISNENGLKESYERLRKAYGGSLERITSERPLMPVDFNNDELVKEMAEKVIKFQENIAGDETQKSLADYFQILGKEEETLKPAFLVAPYFYFSSTEDPWYKISVEVAHESKNYKGKNKIYSVICAPKTILLDRNILEKLQEDYKRFDGYIILISDFREREEEKYLYGLAKFVKKMSELKKPVHMLFGGYFSLILYFYGLTSYSRAICYGESRNIEAEGGITAARMPKNYYFNMTHSKIPETVARAFYTTYPGLLCECDVCSKLPRKNIEEFFNSMDFYSHARGHFMHVHNSEIMEISKLKYDGLVQKLKEEYEECKKRMAELYNISYDHLLRWKKMMERNEFL